MKQLSIARHISSKLQGNSGLSERVGARIYPLATDATTFPYIIFMRTGINPEYDKGDFASSSMVSAEVAVVADKYSDAVEIAELCIEALDGVTAEYDGFRVDFARLESAIEGFAGDAFTQNLVFNFHITE